MAAIAEKTVIGKKMGEVRSNLIKNEAINFLKNR